MAGEPPAEALPLDDRARVAIGALALVILAALLSIWADLHQVNLLDGLLNGERVTLAEAQDSDDRVATIALLYTVAAVLAAIGFLLWYSRAYRNVIAMGLNRPRYGTRWAVAYWFIPIVNLFRPKQVINDIWRGSNPDLGPNWQQSSLHPLLLFWWIAWLVSAFAARYAINQSFDDVNTLNALHDEAVAYVVSDICDAIAGVLAIGVVVMLTRRNNERKARVGVRGPESPLGQPDPPIKSEPPVHSNTPTASGYWESEPVEGEPGATERR